MKKLYRHLIVAIGVVASLSSCTDFLDLKPEDRLIEEQVFSSPRNIKAYLNGIYVKLGANALYGENLTLTIPDVMAQHYNMANASGVNIYNQFAIYAYGSAQVSNKMAEIWAGAYNAIFNANRFMAGLDKAPGILDAKTDSTCRGEALAMRAMLHFDMLRLFGPVYSTADSTSNKGQKIPYCTSGEVTVNPFMRADSVMNHIMTDLSKAESLLSTDKSMTYEKKYKFTYYSVKALQARVYMYRGNKPAALACAKALIDNNPLIFPWVDKLNILNEKSNPDKIFSNEMIFGAYNPDLQKASNGFLKIFSSGLNDNNILAPKDERLTALFNPEGISDYRYSFQHWDAPANKLYKTFLKYADVENKTMRFRNTIPLLKLSEMFYIAAECEAEAGNMTIANSYLNTVRSNRGINTTAFPVTATPAEILKEYRKEFFGEGQLWFYYKRTNSTTIPDGNKVSDTPIDMFGKYVVPIPFAEIDNR